VAARIFHIAVGEDWERQKSSGEYRHPSLESDGYIHCSEEHQVPGTLEKFFTGREGLVLLEIDTARLVSELRHEEGEPGVLYPHVYGPLNVDAVVAVKRV
jgi:uncharacterized protein (DUF952 family)